MQGHAFIFLRQSPTAPLLPGCEGHLAWGFEDVDQGGSLVCGSTDNLSGLPQLDSGCDNGFWEKSFHELHEMMNVMHLCGYDAFKMIPVDHPCPEAAYRKVAEVAAAGYDIAGNNMLNHAASILHAYGLEDLPFVCMHPSPREWFKLLKAVDFQLSPGPLERGDEEAGIGRS